MQERALKETPKILKLCDFIGLQKKKSKQNKTNSKGKTVPIVPFWN